MNFEGAVSGSRGRIAFHGNSLDRTVPAEEVAVLLVGAKATIEPSLVQYVHKHDVAVLFTDWRGIPIAGVFPWSGHTRVGARHIAQSQLSIPRKKNAWKQIVCAKISGQAATLEALDSTGAERVRALAQSVRSGDPANAEGTAARLYWGRLFPRDVRFVRDPDSGDPANSFLNYGYAVLRGHCIRSVLAAGLSPPLGVFHRGRSNYFNLVDDLIEPFRPAVDAAVAALDSGSEIDDPQVRKRLVAAASQPFERDGRRIPAVMDDLAQQFGRYVEGDIDRLVVAAWNGPKAPPLEEFDDEA